MLKLILIAILFLVSYGTATSQIYRVADMNVEQIRSLDKQKTVVLLPGGVLEQHGPHLPSFTDGYSNAWMTERLAEAIVRRPGWAALVFPIMPLGHAGANEIGARPVYPGTYSIRRSTLRAIYMDLATELGEQGFRSIFVMNAHGAPYHNLVIDQAGDFFRDTYGGRMVNLHGLEPTPEQATKLKLPASDFNPTEAERIENGIMDVHAGLDETSRLMFLRPDLVNPVFRSLQPFAANSLPELFRTAQASNWQGYIGSPRLATAAYGAQLEQHRAMFNIALVNAILDGYDERELPRYGTFMTGDKMVVQALASSTKYEAETARKQSEWMRKKGID